MRVKLAITDSALGGQPNMAEGTRQFVVDDHGRKSAVLLPIADYERLMEDLDDLAVIAERRDEPTEPFPAVKRRLEAKWRATEST